MQISFLRFREEPEDTNCAETLCMMQKTDGARRKLTGLQFLRRETQRVTLARCRLESSCMHEAEHGQTMKSTRRTRPSSMNDASART
eukprot:scaffold36310_cov16-Prasinocladus_malaysianus.AAC.1